MRKATIASIVLALLMAANAAAATNRVPIMKRKGEMKGALKELLKNMKKRDNSQCSVVTCLAEGDTCSSDNESYICSNLMSCTNRKCSVFTEGGPCDEDGYCDNSIEGDGHLYCSDTDNKCHKYRGEGESCTMYGSECGYEYFCNAKDEETPGVCVKHPTKAGDACISDYHCPNNLKCYNSVCTEPPTTVGAECHPYYLPCVGTNLTCSSADKKCVALPSEGEACLSISPSCGYNLYCDSASSKCAKLPVAGEECINGYVTCAAGHYCDSITSKCAEYPGLGEECHDYNHCGPELECAYDYDVGKSICRSTDGNEGSYCDDDTPCNEGFVCNSDRYMCVEGPSGKECVSFKCVDFFSVADGGECNNEIGSTVCKEGSGCVPDSTSSTGHKCMKITTKIEDEIPCTGEGDPSCPGDSRCYCNAINGMMQCVPYPANSKVTAEYYKKLWEFDDIASDDARAYMVAISKALTPYDKDSHCMTPIPLPPDPASSEPISSTSASSEPSPASASSDSTPGGSSDRKPLAFSLVLLIVGLIKAFF